MGAEKYRVFFKVIPKTCAGKAVYSIGRAEDQGFGIGSKIFAENYLWQNEVKSI